MSRERELLEKYFDENLGLKAEKLIERHKYEIPEDYCPDWYSSYDCYLNAKVKVSPSNIEKIKRFLREGENLSAGIDSPDQWYATIYDHDDFIDEWNDSPYVGNFNPLWMYLNDAALLVYRVESAVRWGDRLYWKRKYEYDKGEFWWIPLLIAVLVAIFNESLRSVAILLSLGIVGIMYGNWKSRGKRCQPIDEEIKHQEECLAFHRQQALCHPFVRQHNLSNPSYFYGTLRNYVENGQANTLQEALNIYEQERRHNELMQAQRDLQAQMHYNNKLQTFDTVYNILKPK